MRAVQFDDYGDPDVLHVTDADEPHAGAGQIRVAVRAAGVSPFDWKLRSGAMRESFTLRLPHIPGLEVAGVVDEVGDEVTGVPVGAEVFGPTWRGTAEYAVLDHFARKPAGMSWAEAAGLPGAVEAATRGLGHLGVKAGQTVLINGAAGAVGTAATQLAAADGVRVIGTASEANHEHLRALGAIPLSYGAGLVARVREVAPGGVDLAFDVAGHGALPDLIALTGSPDNVITIADGDAARHGVRFTGESSRYDALATAARLFEQGRLAMPIARTFTMEQAAEAHRTSEGGHVRGKLVIVVA